MLALWVDFPYHFACRRRLRSTVPAFPGLLVPCVRRTSHSISSENCTGAGSEMEHVFARAASAGRPAIAGRFEFVTPPLLLPLRLSVPPLQDLLSSTAGGYRGRCWGVRTVMWQQPQLRAGRTRSARPAESLCPGRVKARGALIAQRAHHLRPGGSPHAEDTSGTRCAGRVF